MFKHNWRMARETDIVFCSSCTGFRFSLWCQNNSLFALPAGKFKVLWMLDYPPEDICSVDYTTTLLHHCAEPEGCQSQKRRASEQTSKYKWSWKWPLFYISSPLLLPSNGRTNYPLSALTSLILYIEDLQMQNTADFYKSIDSHSFHGWMSARYFSLENPNSLEALTSILL